MCQRKLCSARRRGVTLGNCARRRPGEAIEPRGPRPALPIRRRSKAARHMVVVFVPQQRRASPVAPDQLGREGHGLQRQEPAGRIRRPSGQPATRCSATAVAGDRSSYFGCVVAKIGVNIGGGDGGVHCDKIRSSARPSGRGRNVGVESACQTAHPKHGRPRRIGRARRSRRGAPRRSRRRAPPTNRSRRPRRPPRPARRGPAQGDS